MRRREFFRLLGSVIAGCPLIVRAQQLDRVRRIGVLMGYAEGDREGEANFAAFREGLRKLGWTEGRDILIDSRWAAAEAPIAAMSGSGGEAATTPIPCSVPV